jgi:hypothetical protein
LAAEVEAEGAIGRVWLLPAGYRRWTGGAMGAVGDVTLAVPPPTGGMMGARHDPRYCQRGRWSVRAAVDEIYSDF